MTVTREWLFEVLEEVRDPEIPALSILDMAILRDVEQRDEEVVVTITPTYSGCPAMQMIEDEICQVLRRRGVESVRVERKLSPAWTTDWMSEEAKAKLKASGIAPPCHRASSKDENPLVSLGAKKDAIACPFCDSENTSEKSQFGSTACKSIWFCNSCHQPFDYFKAF